MKTMFLVMMIAFGSTAIATPIVSFNNESLMMNHENLIATLFYGCGAIAMLSSILFSIKKG
jgi:hypothetical protein